MKISENSLPKGNINKNKRQWLPLDAYKTMDFTSRKRNRIDPKPVVEVVDGKIVRKWGSVRQASKELYLTRQTIINYCNGKTKKKQVELKWGDKINEDNKE